MRIKAAALAAVITAAAGTAIAAPAFAAPAPVAYTASIGKDAVTVSASGTGAAAAVNAAGTLSLTVGTPASSTYAQAVLTLPNGSVLPATAPSLATDNYAAGSPRWVLELGNGDIIDGYPAQLGGGATADFTGSQWTAETATGTLLTTPEYTTYTAAVTAAGGAGEAVKEAFIVADGDQAAGTTDTVSAVQYGGVKLTVRPLTAPRPHLLGGHVISVSNNDAVLGWKDGPGVHYVLARTFGYDMTQADGQPHYGFTSATAGYWSGLAAGHTYDIELIPAGANGQPLPGAVIGWINVVTTR